MAKILVLAFDGGGVRGYITASVLQKLVDKTVGNFLPQVGLVAGTSTGSFIALALAAGTSVDTIQALYQQSSAQTIFTPNPSIQSAQAELAELRARMAAVGETSSWWQLILKYFDYLIYAQYTNTGLASVAQGLLGSTTLSSLAPVIVNTLQLDSASGWTPTVLSNLAGSPYGSMLAYEAGLCSGAAPIYFPPFSPTSATSLGYCADGGLFANNPSLSAITGALALGYALSDIYVLSFDTGTSTDAMPASVITGWGGPLDMGPLEWLFPATMGTGTDVAPKFPLLSAIMDSSSTAITLNSQALLGSANYLRVTVPLTTPVALDDTSSAAYTTMNNALTSFYATSAYTGVATWLQKNFPIG